MTCKEWILKVPAARMHAVNLTAMRNNLEKKLAKTIASQAKYYNAKHLPKLYNIGEFVYLNSKNIDPTRPIKKLDWKFYGLYRVINNIGKVAYKF